MDKEEPKTYQTFPDGTPEGDEQDKTSTYAGPEPTYTVEEAVEAIKFGPFQIKLTVVAGFAWIADSMEIMVLSILGPTLLCEWNLTTTQEALITTVVFIGFTIGSPIMGWFADKYGRKTCLIFTAVWSAAYGMLSATAPVYIWLIVLRTMTGFGLAGVPQAVTYYTEYLPRKQRGKCVILLEMFFALGAVLEVVLAMVVLQNAGWRWWLVASAAPLIIFLPLISFMPESPRYLLASGQPEAAMKALERGARDNGTSLPPGKLRPEPQSKRGNLKEMFHPDYIRTSLILFYVWFAVTFSYYGTILFTTDLIKAGTSCFNQNNLGLTGQSLTCPAMCQKLTMSNYIQLLWTSSAEIPGLILTAIYVDWIGRKYAISINLILFGLVCLLLFICSNNTTMVALLFVARALISSAFQVVYVYTPEIYPTSIRALGIGVCNFFARFGAVITPFVAEVLLTTSPFLALSLYAGVGVSAGLLVFALPIETQGRQMKMGTS